MKILFKCTIPGRVGIKKNSKQIFHKNGRTIVIPSKEYAAWAKIAKVHIAQASRYVETIDVPVNLCCVFFYKDKRRPDLSNAYQGIEDLLQECCVLLNDKLIYSHDGSHFETDKEERVIVTLTTYEGKHK